MVSRLTKALAVEAWRSSRLKEKMQMREVNAEFVISTFESVVELLPTEDALADPREEEAQDDDALFAGDHQPQGQYT